MYMVCYLTGTGIFGVAGWAGIGILIGFGSGTSGTFLLLGVVTGIPGFAISGSKKRMRSDAIIIKNKL